MPVNRVEEENDIVGFSLTRSMALVPIIMLLAACAGQPPAPEAPAARSWRLWTCASPVRTR